MAERVVDKKLKEPRTQILITDIPKNIFDSKWPDDLKKQLFELKFPELKKKLQYYTPLAFLNRIVIIFDDETTTMRIYDFLKQSFKDTGRDFKIYLAESLLMKPRSKSADDLGESGSSSEELNDEKKPILSIDTNPSNTGVNSSSLSLGSPSLSPERSTLESPTLLKFDSQSKLHYYKEPLPKFTKSNSQSSISSTDFTKYLFKPEPSPITNPSSSGLTPTPSSDLSMPPPSPSITLNEFTH